MFIAAQFSQFNRELEPLAGVLLEYPINFPPTYPYEEEPDQPHDYMHTRCPAWCDRVLMSATARDLFVLGGEEVIDGDATMRADEYDVIGDAVCMGDHKVSGQLNKSGEQSPSVEFMRKHNLDQRYSCFHLNNY